VDELSFFGETKMRRDVDSINYSNIRLCAGNTRAAYVGWWKLN
jgi:hypothetical protein